MSTENCTPSTPDVGGAIEKATSQYGKRPNINFRPVNFDTSIGNFITFDALGKILGKPKGLGYDMCAICDSDGGGVDDAISNSVLGDSGMSGLQDQVNANSEQIDELGDSSP